MKDQIHIEGLLLRTTLGVDQEQRTGRQDIRVDLKLETQTDWPAISYKIEDAVNYHVIAKRVSRLVEQARFYLLEKMATEIAAICLENQRVEQVRVRVEKPAALRSARSVAVEIERTRANLRPATHRVFLALSHRGTSHDPLRGAVEGLHGTMSVLAISPIYKRSTEDDGASQVFLHAAALVETSMTPAQLRQYLRKTEETVAQEHTGDQSAGNVQLRIALYDNARFDLVEERVPHPGILTEVHLATPLADLAPAYRHPMTGEPLEDIADALPDANIEKTDITL